MGLRFASAASRARRTALAALCAGAALGLPTAASLALPAVASAEMVALQFASPTAPAPTPTDLAPIAPGDPAWNTTFETYPGEDPGGTHYAGAGSRGPTDDYVEYARTVADGSDTHGPLRGTLLADFDHLDPALPAVVVISGGLVAGLPCSERRASQARFAELFTAKGYLTFLPDFAQPSNDRQTTLLGQLLTGGGKGDCMADDGWEPGAKQAQIGLQLAVRSLKTILATYARDHAGDPSAAAFANASRKVVAFGGSSGGHLAARLALRSKDLSHDPADGPQNDLGRRVAGAVAIGSIGECTAHNGVRTVQKVFGLAAFTKNDPQPFSGCGPVTADADSSPIEFFNGVFTTWVGLGPVGRWAVMDSPLSGTGRWGRQIGWDWVGDARWPKATCDDLNAVRPGLCTFEAFRVTSSKTHFDFPLKAKRPGAGARSPTYWNGTVFPQLDAFFRSVRADDAAAAPAAG